MTDESYDAVIVGAGPSGCVAALSLARRGYRVCIADAASDRARLCDILAPVVVRLLRTIVPIRDPAPDIVRRCRGVLSRWGHGEPEITDYELLSTAPGWIVARPAFDRIMLEAVTCEVAAVRLGWTAVAAERSGIVHRVSFATASGPVTVTARAVVYATGRSASFRTAQRTYEDRQVAISTIVAGAQLHSLLWVENGTTSWWYLCDGPLGAQLVWVTRYDAALRTAFSRAQAMQSRLGELTMIRSALPRNVHIVETQIYDARLSRVGGSLHRKCFCAGDAAETSDPLSGRGWHRAISSALATANAVDRALGGSNATMAPRMSARQTYSDHVAGRARQWRTGYAAEIASRYP